MLLLAAYIATHAPSFVYILYVGLSAQAGSRFAAWISCAAVPGRAPRCGLRPRGACLSFRPLFTLSP